MKNNCKHCWETIDIKYDTCDMCSDLINERIIIERDWNSYCCHWINFTNLQEDIAWFWTNAYLAYENYIKYNTLTK